MTMLRSLLLLPALLLLPHLSWGGELEDFRKALSELRVGEHFTPRDYLHCVDVDAACSHLEGDLGTVQIELELHEGIISDVQVMAEGVRLDRELLTVLHDLYGTGERKQEGAREESIQPDLALTIASASYVSYEWQRPGARIILFSQDPFRIIHSDGRVEITEPMRTYVSGELVPPR